MILSTTVGWNYIRNVFQSIVKEMVCSSGEMLELQGGTGRLTILMDAD